MPACNTHAADPTPAAMDPKNWRRLSDGNFLFTPRGYGGFDSWQNSLFIIVIDKNVPRMAHAISISLAYVFILASRDLKAW
jgi:hypothetical protein